MLLDFDILNKINARGIQGVAMPYHSSMIQNAKN